MDDYQEINLMSTQSIQQSNVGAAAFANRENENGLPDTLFDMQKERSSFFYAPSYFNKL